MFFWVLLFNCRVDVEFPVVGFYWVGLYVVRPRIEGIAARDVESGVVPWTGQDAVLD